MNSRASGARRILVYNWPIFAGTWVGSVAVAVLGARVGGAAGTLLVVGALVAAVWSAGALATSFYVYDRSPLARGVWLRKLLPARTETWATIDAGLDAEVALDDALPGRCVARLDVFDGEIVGAGSVRRAREATPRRHPATRCLATQLALADGSCDVVAVVFTAHEVKRAEDRARFFLEVRRALRDGGRLVLVEHLRDAPNFLAFGPGFLHFLPRAEWLRVARAARLSVTSETRVTPWVAALSLEKTP